MNGARLHQPRPGHSRWPPLGHRSQAAHVASKWRAGSLHCSCPRRLGSSLQHGNIAAGTTWACACNTVETLSAPPAERRACVPSDANVVAASLVLIDLTNQQVGNEAVAQRIRPEPFGDVGGLGCFDDDANELPRASRLHRVLPRNSRPSRCIKLCCRPTFHHSRTSARAGPMRAWLCDSASPLPCATRSSMRSLSRLQPSASTPPRHAGGRHMTASCKPTPETGLSGYGPDSAVAPPPLDFATMPVGGAESPVAMQDRLDFARIGSIAARAVRAAEAA